MNDNLFKGCGLTAEFFSSLIDLENQVLFEYKQESFLELSSIYQEAIESLAIKHPKASEEFQERLRFTMRLLSEKEEETDFTRISTESSLNEALTQSDRILLDFNEEQECFAKSLEESLNEQSEDLKHRLKQHKMKKKREQRKSAAMTELNFGRPNLRKRRTTTFFTDDVRLRERSNTNFMRHVKLKVVVEAILEELVIKFRNKTAMKAARVVVSDIRCFFRNSAKIAVEYFELVKEARELMFEGSGLNSEHGKKQLVAS